VGSFAVFILNKRGQRTRGSPPIWELGKGLTSPHLKNPSYYEMSHWTSELYECLERGG
jgi:hypothetical protein